MGLYFILFISSYLLLSYEKENKIEQHLQIKTKQYVQNYNSMYSEYKKIAEIIFKTKIDTDETLDIFKDATAYSIDKRAKAKDKLHEHLKDTYSMLNTHNIKQLHFHLPNNESFLRFHRPKIYGDNLSNSRESVVYVNKYKKPIDGFEEGKIYNGYRFIFPLFEGKDYLGSVEISFSTFAMNLDFMQNYDVTANFLILKSVVEKKVFENEKKNYINSAFEKFYFEKAMLESIIKMRDDKVMQALSDKTLAIMDKRAQDNVSFSLYDSTREEVMTFIKVQNSVTKKVVGIFVVRSDAVYILNKIKFFNISVVLVNLFIAFMLFFLYKEIIYRERLKNTNKKLEDSKNELQLFNYTLEDRIKDEVKKNRDKDKKMLNQSRLAQMGELISMIAHQWRQPLSAIAARAIGLKVKMELGVYDFKDEKGIENCRIDFLNGLDGIEELTKTLTTTIDDFRNFYKKSNAKQLIDINVPIIKALNIIKTSLVTSNIEIIEDYKSMQKLELLDSEVMQVVLNILKNAQDNFILKKIVNAIIKISTIDTENKTILTIFDNGGGVSEDIIENIFDPYFSTKEKKNGTGLGLYMSKIIIEEHHNGIISAKNIDDGVLFKIELFKQGKSDGN